MLGILLYIHSFCVQNVSVTVCVLFVNVNRYDV